MKNLNFQKALLRGVLLCVIFFGLLFTSCEDEKDSQKGNNLIRIASFLDKPENRDKYSEFTALIKAAGMYNQLNNLGVFTCFAPTNQAVINYYERNNTSLEQLSELKIRRLVYAHIISGQMATEPFHSLNFPAGPIPTPNMNGDNIRIGSKGDGRITVNDFATILELDNEVLNGVIHTIDYMLETPSGEIMDALSRYTDFSLFTEAFELTGMVDSVYLEKNENYQYQGGIYPDYGIPMRPPLSCEYGYTVFMESNNTFANAKIHNLQDLIEYTERIYYELFPLKGTLAEQEKIKNDYTDRHNALNRFVSYHMMDRMIDTNEFILPYWSDHFVPNTVIREYIEMMMPNSTIEIQTGNIINKRESKNTDIKISEKIGTIKNILFHEINNLLTYEGVEAEVLNKRLRIDVASLISEFATNKLRANYPYYVIPLDYLEKNKCISYSEETLFKYHGSNDWHGMYGDEFLFLGKYDFSLTTPPIPAGKWEVRIGYIANALRGTTQIYLNGKAAGLPFDFRTMSPEPEPRIELIEDEDIPDNDVEDEKALRNLGLMRGPASIIQCV